MLNRFSLCTPLLAFLAAPAWAQTGMKPDFNGTWALNLAKSKLEIQPPTSSTFYITHKEPVFRLERTHVYNEKSNTRSIELITGGPEVVRKEDNFHARLFWKQNALVLDSYWIEDGTKTTNIVTYTISNDRLVFTADEQVAGPKVKHHNVWIFDRR
jgi:hypothetical protein